MYLSAIKLAGFKSFVDPTHISFCEKLIGVVGPNGCGKSNIVDAIRWVLGESKASSLRGENLTDVIFNGSDQRKAVDRASIELIFDNSDGRLGGQWGQFAEISVRRVLDRQGESLYQINRQNVRKKDITALFLGTGVGARGYSIIEQGTISRFIEAKPEEVRLILEETAGVSKYRERRKETEHRLIDAKNHLERLTDIMSELTTQIEKLTDQAATATHYQALLTQRQQKMAQLAWLLLRAATEKGEKLAALLIEKAVDLEKSQARKTAILLNIEKERIRHQDCLSALDQAQAGFYQANGEVIRIETTIKHHHLALDKLKQQLMGLSDKKNSLNEALIQRKDQIQMLSEQLAEDTERLTELNGYLESLTQTRDEKEVSFSDIRQKRDTLKEAKIQCQQALALEAAHHRHATQQIDALEIRLEKIRAEKLQLAAPIAEDMDTLEETLAETLMMVDTMSDQMVSLQEQQADELEKKQIIDQKLGILYKDIAQIEAQMTALEEQQHRTDQEDKMAAWFEENELTHQHPLWQSLVVDREWDVAVEAILRERLSSKTLFDLSAARAFFSQRPPLRFTFYARSVLQAEGSGLNNPLPWESLSSKVTCDKKEQQVILDEWLSGIFLVETPEEALLQRETLPYGACFVTKTGDIVDRNSVTWFSAQSGVNNMLSLQRKLQDYQAQKEILLAQQIEASAQKQQIEGSLADIVFSLDHSSASLRQAEKESYEIKMKLSAAQEKQQQMQLQKDRVDREEAGILSDIEKAAVEQEKAQLALETHENALIDIEERYEDLQIEFEAQESDCATIMMQAEEVKRQIQQTHVDIVKREAQKAESTQTIDQILLNLGQLQDEIEATEEEMLSADREQMTGMLNQALTHRAQAEDILNVARKAADDAVIVLQTLEGDKARSESEILTIQEGISELRLQVQAQSLKAAQYQEQLDQAGGEVSPEWQQAELRESQIQQRLRQIDAELESLGAVNLAAVEELSTATQRHGFLSDQIADITEAMTTLENAIAKIDREAKALLLKTFESVNENFGKIFPMLFGGGQAKLTLEGDDLLSAGVKIMAQPPGKRNATIFLLSGGEKALTAVALVFSLFTLNPAPFCVLDEIDAPLDDPNTMRLCDMIKSMSDHTQFLFITHNKITMELAERLVGVTMPESGISRIVDVNVADALKMSDTVAG